MVLYFSGTGNSRFVAQRLAGILNDDLVSLNRQMRMRRLDPYNAQYAYSSEKPFVIVCPTYCWHIPLVVVGFLKESRLVGSTDLYFLLTCGSGTGQAFSQAEQLCKNLSMNFMGLSSVRMPENYITLFHAPTPDKAVGIIRAAMPQVGSIAAAIQRGRTIQDSYSGPAMPNVLFKAFYRFFMRDRAFRVKENCTGCATCVRLCPTANIRMKNGHPVWLGHCTQCQACIAICPEDAIEYGIRSRGKRRYYLFADGRQKFPKNEQKEESR